MSDGYDLNGNNDTSTLEDELLCEYVDGTMDPVVREAFEEYLVTNPELAEHVVRLRLTRQLLCRCGRLRVAPKGLQIRIRRRLYREMMHSQSPPFPYLPFRLRSYATFSSAIIVIMVVGMVSGTLYLNGRQVPTGTDTVSAGLSRAAYASFYDQSELPPIFIPQAVSMSSALRPRISPLSSTVFVRSSTLQSNPNGSIREGDLFYGTSLKRRPDLAP